jgi:outer membrane immunogenic protein
MGMKHARAWMIAGAGSLALSAATWAADLGGAPRDSPKDYPPPYAAAFSWTGLYIGAHVGYAWSETDWHDALSSSVTGSSGGGSLAGAQIGYNYQMRQLVLGAEADASGTWLNGNTSCPNSAFNCGYSYNWLTSLRGRAGVAINGNRTLLYGTGGVAWADIDYAAKDAATGIPIGTGFSQTHIGWVAGGGIEHMLTPNLSARLEYLYYGFDGTTAPAGSLGAGSATLNPSTQTVRFGLNLKF